MTNTSVDPISEEAKAFGAGLYSFPYAARILARRTTALPVTAERLRYWMKVGLTPATYGRGEKGSLVLSFHDLISLEVIRRFRELGASLQNVRALEVVLRKQRPEVGRPFAHEVFYTDGAEVWGQLKPGDNRLLVQLLGRTDQLSWTGPVKKFATEIRYSQGFAARWELSPWIEIDPRIHFGAPVVRGTSVPVSTIRAGLEVGNPDEVAGWYGLEPEQVAGVKEYIDAA